MVWGVTTALLNVDEATLAAPLETLGNTFAPDGGNGRSTNSASESSKLRLKSPDNNYNSPEKMASKKLSTWFPSPLKQSTPNQNNESSTLSISSLNHSTANHSLASPEWELSSFSVVNGIMTTRDPVNPSCHRSCADFRNKIYFSPAVDHPGAGLIDRLTIFSTLLNLAGYFCARLYVPRPKFLLSAHHNGNQSLDAQMPWSEFGSFTFWNDEQRQPALVDWDNDRDIEKAPLLESLMNLTTNALLFRVSFDSNQVRRHFRVMEKYTVVQQQHLFDKNNNHSTRAGNHSNSFVWVLRSDFYEWCNELSRHLIYRPPLTIYKDDAGPPKRMEPFIFATKFFYVGCQYAKVRLPTHLLEMQERVVGQILRQSRTTPQSKKSSTATTTDATSLSPLVGYIHIRRQDTKLDCDTSPESLSIYLNCSLGEAIAQLSITSSSRSNRRVIILFSSDEDNQQYRRLAMQLIEGQQHKSRRGGDITNVIHMAVIDLDHLVQRAIHTQVDQGRIPSWRNNNFYLFQLVFSIGFNQTVVKFRMEQRRHNCGGCTNVTEQLFRSGVF